ncbi:MAG: hypothetical protein ACE5FM_05950, partial [Methyloligellaceae bacterium]
CEKGSTMNDVEIKSVILAAIDGMINGYNSALEAYTARYGTDREHIEQVGSEWLARHMPALNDAIDDAMLNLETSGGESSAVELLAEIKKAIKSLPVE